MHPTHPSGAAPAHGGAARAGRPPGQTVSSQPRLAASVREAVARARRWLLDRQHADGHWCAELEGDSILQSEYILLLAFLGREGSEISRRAAQRLVETQLPDGGWAMFPGGKVEISASVKAYFALKLTGHDPEAEYMRRARAAVLRHGGADAVNSYTRFYLALLGQISYEFCPAVPPEIMLLPRWLPVHLGAVSAWSRTILVPLSVLSAFRPVRQLGPELGVRELFLKEPREWPPLRCPGLKGGTGLLSWDRFFRTVDGLLKWFQRRGLLPLRRRAVRAAEKWMLERFQRSDGLGAIFPPIVWSVVALKCLGHADDSPEVRECLKQLFDLILQDEQTGSVRLQPCKSPVWDTAIALRAVAAAGFQPGDPALRCAADWLLKRQITAPGDWADSVRVAPGGWCFEYRNDFYPDNDDTAMVLMALWEQYADTADQPDAARRLTRRMARPETSEVSKTSEVWEAPGAPTEAIAWTAAAIERGVRWMLAMQNRDGGWGAFDRDNDRQFLNHVPFADHNAMIDPSTPDLTGRVLEALGTLGFRRGNRAVDRAVAYLRRTQEPDGAWFGRWGVNYVYGAWQVLAGLAAVGVDRRDPAVQRGARWLLACQQPCGGWGETAASYDDPSLRGQGPPTASQTAWALLGLMAAGMAGDPAVERGVRFLVERQRADGAWNEPEFTGTGFPRVFYLKYHYYPVSFPLMALARWAKANDEA